MSYDRTIPAAFAQGFSLCSPAGILLPHSFRRTKAAAIASVFTDPAACDANWHTAEAQGMTIKFVYARIFQPRFFASAVLDAIAEKEMAGAA